MVRDAETGDYLALGDLWDIGFAVGLMMRPESALGDGIAGKLTAVDRAHLLDGYAHGRAEADAIRSARAGAGVRRRNPLLTPSPGGTAAALNPGAL